MSALLQGFPKVSIIDYGGEFPQTWAAVQLAQVGVKNAFADNVNTNFWSGLTSVPGYGQILFLDEAFYKATQVSGASWDAALAYDQRSFFSLMSRTMSAWPAAASHVAKSPFAWIDDGGTSFSSPKSRPEVADQLSAFERWGMDGEFGLYQHQGLNGFDYSGYLPPPAPDSRPASPPMVVISATRKRTLARTTTTVLDVRGWVQASDAVRVVRWTYGRQSGTARLAPLTGDPMTGGAPRLQWTFTIPRLQSSPTLLSVTASSIRGSTSGVRTAVT
jgi:hypothetical protein